MINVCRGGGGCNRRHPPGGLWCQGNGCRGGLRVARNRCASGEVGGVVVRVGAAIARAQVGVGDARRGGGAAAFVFVGGRAVADEIHDARAGLVGDRRLAADQRHFSAGGAQGDGSGAVRDGQGFACRATLFRDQIIVSRREAAGQLGHTPRLACRAGVLHGILAEIHGGRGGLKSSMKSSA